MQPDVAGDSSWFKEAGLSLPLFVSLLDRIFSGPKERSKTAGHVALAEE